MKDWSGFSQSEGSILVPNLVFNYVFHLVFNYGLASSDCQDVCLEYHEVFLSFIHLMDMDILHLQDPTLEGPPGNTFT